MEVLFWLVMGFITSAALIKFVHHQSPGSRFNILGKALVIAALIYVLFAVLGSNPTWIGIELLGVLLYGVLFLLAKRRDRYLLALGWLLHPVWDVGLHLFGSGASFAPNWYVLMCISFDVTVACYLFAQARNEAMAKQIV